MTATTLSPPQDLEAEMSVLGALLIGGTDVDDLTIGTGLAPEHFYRESHGIVYAAIRRLRALAEPIDVITVADQLAREGELERVGGRQSLEALAVAVPAVAHAARYASIVREMAATRAVLAATYEIQQLIAERRHDANGLLEAAEQTIFRIAETARRNPSVTLGSAATEELDRLEAAMRNGRDILGLTTGFPGLDDILGGLQDGNLVVLAARPAMGKSTLGLNIAVHASAREQVQVLFASLEMSRSELTQRYFAGQARVASTRLRNGRLEKADWPPLYQAAARAQDLPFTLLDDSDLSVADLRAQARRIAAKPGARLGLVVVDYLQLLRGERERADNRTEEVSQFSRGLKRLARELSCPVLALSQLNRAVEQRNDKRPLLSDLRESGSIEADADAVLMLYRDDYYHPDSERPGETDVLVRKNRHGGHGELTLELNTGRLQFSQKP